MVVAHFDTIRIRNFRNLREVELKPGQHFNIFSGHNGAGKSNILEAIYYLCSLASFRTNTHELLVRQGENQASLWATLNLGSQEHTLSALLDLHASRKLELNHKRLRSRAPWLQTAPAVLFHPGDLRLVSGSSEHRRVWIDRVLEQVDPIFADASSTYDRALKARNRLLKQGVSSRPAFSAYEEILVSAGSVIAQSRKEMSATLAPRVADNFRKIFGEVTDFDLHYQPNVELESFARTLQQNFADDLARGHTTRGMHRDEIAILYEQNLAREFASQGQQRSITLALRLAELDILTRITGKIPILLLDDLSSELDNQRNERLFALLGELGGQVFLSTTHPEFIRLQERRVDYAVLQGAISLAPTHTTPARVPQRQRRPA